MSLAKDEDDDHDDAEEDSRPLRSHSRRPAKLSLLHSTLSFDLAPFSAVLTRTLDLLQSSSGFRSQLLLSASPPNPSLAWISSSAQMGSSSSSARFICGFSCRFLLFLCSILGESCWASAVVTLEDGPLLLRLLLIVLPWDVEML